ncbi:MAG: fibronectin type III domain-containing protein [Lachnospiraceae bacterium]|nr:fibronectin type III domain-containing protein [Lachnospiraceae bacterium]
MKKIKRLIILCAIMATVFGFSSIVWGEESNVVPQITGIEQTVAKTDYICVKWNAIKDVSMYEVSYKVENSEDDWITEPKSTPEFSKRGFAAGSIIQIKIRAVVITTELNTKYGEESEIFEAVTAPSEYITVEQTDATANSVSLRWNASKGATQYRIATYIGGKETTVSTVTGTSAVIRNLDPKHGYFSLHIYPQQKSKSGYIAEYECAYFTGTKLVPSKAKGFDFNSTNLKLSWENIPQAEGYVLELYKGKKLVRTYEGAGNSAFLSAVNKNTFYKIRVKTYISFNDVKKYSEWSDNFYFADDVRMVVKRVSKNKIKMSWKKVKGAKDYTIYAAYGKKAKFKKLVTLKKTKYVVTKIRKKPLNLSKKPCYFYVVANTKAEGKKWSSNVVLTWGFKK